MHIYGKDQQAFHLERTEAERWWSRFNVLVVIVQLACFLAAIIRTGGNASNSMSNSFFTVGPLQLKAAYLTPGCSYTVTRTHAFFSNVQYRMSPDNVAYFVSRGALNIRYLMALTGVHVAVSMLNRLWFETNTHEIRYHFVVFRKDMVTTWEVLLMILGAVMTWSVSEENQIMSAYLEACNVTTNGSFYNSVQPYTELIVSYIVSAAVTVINALFAVWNLSKENPRDAMLREDQKRKEEWEKAVRQYYGLPEPTSGDANADQGSPSPPRQPPAVTYADNRGATTAAPGTGQQRGSDPRTQRHPSNGYHDAIRRGFGKPFSALSNTLRGRTQAGDPLVAAQRQQHHNPHHPHPRSSREAHQSGPPPAMNAAQMNAIQQHQQQLQQMSGVRRSSGLQPQNLQQQLQQQGSGQYVPESPHVGPSVSRPLTPLLNEEYDDAAAEGEEMMPRMNSAQAPQGLNARRGGGPQQQQQQPPPAQTSSSHSGRYDLREVAYDDDEAYDSVNVDVTNSSPRGAPSSAHGAAAAAHGAMRSATAPSDTSTALLNARLSAAMPPPPPPGFSGDRRLSGQGGRSQLLAPPSPLQGGGAETTEDTVLQ